MAGWKLRKDKTESETPETEELLAIADAPSEFIVPPLDTAADEHAVPVVQAALAPPTEWETPEETQGQTAKVIDLDEDISAQTSDYLAEYRQHSELQPEEPEAEAEPEDHLEYTEEEEPPPLSAETPVQPEPIADADAFSSTMRLDRSALPPLPIAVESAVPIVAPFIVDVPPQAAGAVTHRLIVHIGRMSAPFDITKDVTTIGRPDSTLHYYPDVEIELDDAISRRHAEIIRRGEICSVADAGSTNGTLLNGESLPPHEEHVLAHGDRIRLGERTEIIFE